MASMKKNIVNQKLRGLATKLIWLTTLVLSSISSVFAGHPDSTTIYQAEYDKQLARVVVLDNRYREFQIRVDLIDTHLKKLEADRRSDWYTRRKLSKLTAEKAAINDDIILTFDEISRLQSEASHIFNRYYLDLSYHVEQILTQLTLTNDTKQRQNLIQKLLEMVEQRSRLLNTQRRFLPTAEILIPEKENLVALIAHSDQRNLIRKDVINVLNEKIRQVDLMITAARTEDQLRKRLNQFNTEMSALSGEVTSYQTAIPATDESNRNNKSNNIFDWGSIPTNENRNVDYQNWLGNAAQPSMPTTLTAIDYLPLIQNIPSTELPLYLTQLDSIRKYYQNQLQEVTKIK